MPEQNQEEIRNFNFMDEEAREEEWAARYPTPLPVKGDKIFVKDADADREFFQKHWPQQPYTDGYRWAADILIRYIRHERDRIKSMLSAQTDNSEVVPFDPTHWLVMPIYFSFRHSLELSLKALLRAQESDGQLPQNKKKLIKTEHDLLELWKTIQPWALKKLRGLESETEAFQDLLKQIHEEDKRSDAGRYAERGDEKPSFGPLNPLSLESVESAFVKMLNYVQRIRTALEDEEEGNE